LGQRLAGLFFDVGQLRGDRFVHIGHLSLPAWRGLCLV
jgi:hypothetical protein